MEILIGFLIALPIGAVIAMAHPEWMAGLIPVVKFVHWVQRKCFGIDKPRIGPESLEGSVAIAESTGIQRGRYEFVGTIKLGSEIWSVRCVQPFNAGQSLVIEAARGAILDVRRR